MVDATSVFAVPVFLVVFRESLETVIIVSVLLAYLKQTLNSDAGGRGDGGDGTVNNNSNSNNNNNDKRPYKRLVRQVWLGTGAGLLVCIVVGGALVGVFYTLGANRWDASEFTYEGAFSLVASVIISVVGMALLRIGKMQDKWKSKIGRAMEGDQVRAGLGPDGDGAVVQAEGLGAPAETGKKEAAVRRWLGKYSMFVLPFVTVLREGIEAIVFVAGVTFSAPATAVPLPVVVGLIAGAAVGYVLYKGGASTRLQFFLVVSTCLLYLVAAGLFSRAVWSFEQQKWQDALGSDAAELGNGPGSYDITKSVWHVNCCSPYVNGGGVWGFFNAIFGWTNSATYGSVIAYNLYWLVIMTTLFVLRLKEVNGQWPLLKGAPSICWPKQIFSKQVVGNQVSNDSSKESESEVEKVGATDKEGGMKTGVTVTGTEDGVTV